MSAVFLFFERVKYHLIIWCHMAIDLLLYGKIKAPKQDVSGKVFVITGGNAGLGLETARQIALMNPKKVYITSRSEERGQKAVKELRAATGRDNIEVVALDLTSFASVQQAAEELKSKEEQIDVLVLNAGIGHYEKEKTTDGYDLMYQSNHLGHHLLLELLLPKIKAAYKPNDPARVVVLSSDGHYGATEQSLSTVEDGNPGLLQYMNTKLLNILFARYMSKKLAHEVVVNAVHPGTVATDFFSKFPPNMEKIAKILLAPVFKHVEVGAATSVFVATAPSAGQVTGQYWANMKVYTPHRLARDDRLAATYMERSYAQIKPAQS